ncbi:ficolin-1-like [Anopheles ziemanni]|uniref:ficolin-1-like n=1 Tax=Anopheles coustani TaxID=139045 RepID=UPI002659A365|nr:ficolin-1-like [Anopheles coustani]XP_058178563.1 ficolin-1-like [Anopheles ziemanni]
MRSSKVYAMLLVILSALWAPIVVQCKRNEKNCNAKIAEQLESLKLDLIEIASDLSGLEQLKYSLAEQRTLLTRRQCAKPLTCCECGETKCQCGCRIPESNYSYCSDIICTRSGIYQIQPENPFKQPMNVLCDQEYGSGGWTVIQYRFDGSVNFYRGWQEYKNGFGSLEGEFWLGLDRIFQLTAFKPLELVILLVDLLGVSTYARYERFEIGDESQGYVLKPVGAYSGTAGDQLTNLVGQNFTTLDKDYDAVSINCAVEYTGAWWHENCDLRSVV